jgi:hypothetical protein
MTTTDEHCRRWRQRITSTRGQVGTPGNPFAPNNRALPPAPPKLTKRDRLIGLTVRAHNAEIAADTSSPAAGNTPVIAAAAEEFAVLSVELMPAKSAAAAAIASGAATTNDIAAVLQESASDDHWAVRMGRS